MSGIGAPALAPLLEAVREELARDPGPVDVARLARVLRERGQVLGGAALLEATARIRDHITGLGPLQHLARPGTTDILVNGDGSVWIEDDSGLRPASIALTAGEARELAVRLAALGGRRLDDAVPFADAHLPGGARFHGVLPPLSVGGALISLRLPSPQALTLEDLQDRGAFDAQTAHLLRALIASRIAFVISGGTGSGKTTLLSALLAQVSPADRIVVVEDAQELSIPHPHVVHLQARHANTEGAGRVDLAELVRLCLRMRPDRIVLGECRGGEIRELLQALNTGHEGGCGTLHANTAADVPARLEALGALGGLDGRALSAQVASALEVVLHLGRRTGRRGLEEIALLERGDDGSLHTLTALDLRDPAGPPRRGPGWERLAARLDGRSR